MSLRIAEMRISAVGLTLLLALAVIVGGCSRGDQVVTIEGAQSCLELAEVFDVEWTQASVSERADLVAAAQLRAQQLGSRSAQDP
ncbi:MAG: hypothetical protein QNL12_16455, partial [Acidimicrobiia bacterium]|nr:hypothetical protein [Acidimicrobiia bacterium]MDX2468904.1 hypothetical protein [Acidimicrobiia bacterium]